VFWVISVYFNIRNTLPKSGKFLLGHPVYEYITEVLLHWKGEIFHAVNEHFVTIVNNIFLSSFNYFSSYIYIFSYLGHKGCIKCSEHRLIGY
jgi:hypothetical protein